MGRMQYPSTPAIETLPRGYRSASSRARIGAAWFLVALLAASLLALLAVAPADRESRARLASLEGSVAEQRHRLDAETTALEAARVRLAKALAEQERMEATVRAREDRIRIRQEALRSFRQRRAEAASRARAAAAEAAEQTAGLP